MLSTIGTPWMWAGFTALVVVALIVDLVVLNAKGAAKVGFREALLWSLACRRPLKRYPRAHAGHGRRR